MQPISTLAARLRENNWLSKETIIFATLPILIPNAFYILCSIYFSPVRSIFISVLGLICVLGLVINRHVFFGLLFLVFLIDSLVFTSFYFQMPLTMIVDSLRYAANLSVFQSLLYFLVVSALLCSFWLTYVTVTRLSLHRHKIRLVPFAMVLTTFCAVDWWVNLTPQKSVEVASGFSESYVPIDHAASQQVDLVEHMETRFQPNVVVVMVEGLGAFTSSKKQEAVWGPLLADEVKQGYLIERGTTEFFGSTTSGEARELCNLKADYRDFRDKDSADCLPQQALNAGYRTAAFHAFTNEFFERKDWFPKIGFQDLFFLEQNAGLDSSDTARRCGSTFRGLCDPDVARSVKSYLIDRPNEPKFVYWLTLNSHKPVQPGEAPARLSCETGGIFEDRELCLMGEQWLNVAHLVRDIALTKHLTNTEFLLVGDHHPPLFSRSGRNQFQPGKVAWLHLKPKIDPRTLTAAGPVQLKASLSN